MAFNLPNISSWFRRNPVYEKTYDGQNWYYIDGDGANEAELSNLVFSQKHPILSGALLFISNLVAQSKYKVINSKTGIEVQSPITELLKAPNYYQTRIDFIEQLTFMKIAVGSAAIWKKRRIGFNDVEALYVLNPELITYPNGYSRRFIMPDSKPNFSVTYDKSGDNIQIPIKDLIFIYDMPNCFSVKNEFLSASRIDGLRQTLQNTNDSLLAKNIILKSNGKEMISGAGAQGTSFPFTPEEQKEAKKAFNNNYGLGKGRSRLYLTKANVDWKSLHVALRDLGLDESVKVDGNLIYTALHIPKDILSLEAKKTTYNNYRESMTSFIEGDITAINNDFTLSLSTDEELIKPGTELVGSYDHLPVMQYVKAERYKATSEQAKALKELLSAGVPEKVALEMVGMPINLKLEKNEQSTESTENSDNQGQGTDS